MLGGLEGCAINDDDGGGCAIDDPSCNPCYGADGFAPSPGPYCQVAGQQQPPAETTQSSPPCTDWGCMPPAFARAMQALTLNPKCFDLFGNSTTRQGKWNPATVLVNLFVSQSGVYGSVNFNYTGSADALTTPTGFLLPSLRNGLVGSGATISINAM